MRHLATAFCLGLSWATMALAQQMPEALADRVMALPMTDELLRNSLRSAAVDFLSEEMTEVLLISDEAVERAGDLINDIVDSRMPDRRTALRETLLDPFEYVPMTDKEFAEFEAFVQVLETEAGSNAFRFFLHSFVDVTEQDAELIARDMRARRAEFEQIANGD